MNNAANAANAAYAATYAVNISGEPNHLLAYRNSRDRYPGRRRAPPGRRRRADYPSRNAPPNEGRSGQRSAIHGDQSGTVVQGHVKTPAGRLNRMLIGPMRPVSITAGFFSEKLGKGRS